MSAPVTPAVAASDAVALLLVEDDAGDALIVQDLLEQVDAAIDLTWVRSIGEAEIALADPVDCVLLDLGLPDASGLGALERIRSVRPEAAVLVLTGLSDTDRGVAALAIGAQDYLVKGQVEPELLARSIRYAVERSRVEGSLRELRAAQLLAEENARLERGLLPRPIVRDPHVRVATGYRPGRSRALLGGDFYDIVEVPDGTVHALVGDVCGHGPDEAALGVALRIAWRTLVLGGRAPDEVLGTLEEVLVHERHGDELFATVCMVTLPPDRATATLRLAGHPAPVLLHAGGATPLAAPPQLPIGVLPSPSWPGTVVPLPAAPFSLVLYTDGLIEGHVGDGPDRLGTERMVAMMAAHGPELAIDALIDEVQAAAGGDLVDDVAVLSLRIAG